MTRDEYDKLGMATHLSYADKKNLKDDEQYQLYKTVPNDRIEPHYKEDKPNKSHMADVMFMPTDKFGYKYILVVCDVYNRLIDAKEMKFKDAFATEDAIKWIYKNGILEKPNRLIVDAGKEFYASFEKHMNNEGVYINHLPAGKHLGVIDSRIKFLTKGLFHQMNEIELKTMKVSKAWVKNLSETVKVLNKFTMISREKELLKLKTNKKKAPTYPEQSIYKIGTRVRTALFKPINSLGQQQSFKFRTGDIRFSREIKTITNILINEGSPVRCVIDNNNKVVYTGEKLQPV